MEQTQGASSEDILAEPVPGGWSMTSEERAAVDLSGVIPGWGTDLDLAMRPGVPRDKAPDLGVEALYPAIEQQVPRSKIHKSTEHGQLTPVFGTSCPPRGLSGALRDIAYRWSEGRLRRWLLLLVADRVDVVEDVLADLSRGRVPNIPKEMGLGAAVRHDPMGLVKKVAIGAIVIGGVALLVKSRRR